MYKFLLTAFFLCSVLPLFAAHNGSINGQLTENESGLELAGATIRLDPAARMFASEQSYWGREALGVVLSSVRLSLSAIS